MTADDLLAIAHDLVRRDAGRPKQASLKRAVSTAYYALYHALAHECVDQTIGWRFHSDRYWELVAPLYRSIDHQSAKKVFERLRNGADASAGLKQIARTFVDLQAERIRADYDPRPAFTRSDSAQLVARSESAVTAFRALPNDTKRDIAVQLITRQR